MTLPDESQLKSFSKKQHSKYVEQALLEGIVAFIPAVIGGIAYFSLRSTPIVQESFAQGRVGIFNVLLPILIVSYVVFILFIWYDVVKRITQA